MTKIISFSGISNSGKTTLIEGLCRILIPEFKVGVVKHDPKSKAVFDTIGKDSYRFFESGAETAIISPKETVIRFHRALEKDDILNIFNYRQPLDYLFIEGFKTMPFRQICVMRGDFVKEDIENAHAIATDRILDRKKLGKIGGKDILDLNDYHKILQWIDSQQW